MTETTTVRVTSQMKEALHAAVLHKYGPKGKSRWIGEAIQRLAQEDPALQSVGQGEAGLRPSERVWVLLSQESVELLQGLVQRVRRQDPLAEGVQSMIVRAAVRHRLESRR